MVGLFNEKADIANNDIERVLGVSDATVTREMNGINDEEKVVIEDSSK